MTLKDEVRRVVLVLQAVYLIILRLEEVPHPIEYVQLLFPRMLHSK